MDSEAVRRSAPLTTLEEEMRAKRAIKHRRERASGKPRIARVKSDRSEKNFRKLLKTNSSVDRDSLKKVERLEKLTKKIRGEAGGEDEEVDI